MYAAISAIAGLAIALLWLARKAFNAGKKEEQAKNAVELLDATKKADAIDRDWLNRGPSGSLDRLRDKYSRPE